MEYFALFEPADEGGFIITFPDLGFGASQAETEPEALEVAEDLLLCLLSISIRDGKTIPAPKKHRGRNYRAIRLPALASIKTELYRAFQASGMRKAELARKLGIPKTNIDRLFLFGHNTRLAQIEAALAAIGKRVSFQIDEAA